jgi:hypothetical protein
MKAMGGGGCGGFDLVDHRWWPLSGEGSPADNRKMVSKNLMRSRQSSMDHPTGKYQ